MVAQVSYGSCPMCEIPKGAPMRHSTFRRLDNSIDQHIYSELLEDINIDALHTLVVHPICNQFWQYPLCNIYRLWQPDELHQLLLGLVKDLLHWLLKYLKARHIEDQFDNRFTAVPRYPGLQHFTKAFDSLKSGTWQGKEIRGMIRTLAVNCAPILVCSKDNRKTASDEMVMGAVQALCGFSPLVSQHNHSDLSLNALDDALKWSDQKKGVFREPKMSKSAKAKVDDLLAMESHQLREQTILKICAAIKALVYGAEKISSTKRRQFQVRLNRAQQAATTWSDAHRQKANGRLEREMHQVTPAKRTRFNKLFQHHERQLLQEVGTKGTGPRSKFAKQLALMKTAAEDEVYGAANMTADKRLQFRIRLSDAETDATTWSLADTERVTNQLEREIYGITSNEQKRLKKEFSIRIIEFEAWWEPIGIQALWRTIEQRVIHFGYPKMHIVSHISVSIRWMGSGDNFTTDIS